MRIKQLAWVRSLALQGHPDFGARMYQLLRSVQTQATNIERQGNLNSQGVPSPPPAIQGVNVTTGPAGEHQVTISDGGEVNRGITYFAEHDSDPGFHNPHVIDMGSSRNASVFMGNQTLYWRAYSAYVNSGASPVAYHGTAGSPIPVTGGIAGPRAPSQGSGTGDPAQGGVGPGPFQYRNQATDGLWNRQQGNQQPGFSGTGTAAGTEAGSQTSGGGGGGSPVFQQPLYDTYAHWTAAKYPPAQYPLFTTFTVTDWNYTTYIVKKVAGVNKWVYESGAYQVAQASIPVNGFNGVALGANDTGLLVSVTDYAHILEWSGSAWAWGPGESGSGYFSDFAVAPTGAGWHACDGSAGVKYLLATGGTATVTLPNTAGSAAYRKNAGTYSDTITAAVAPTITAMGTISASGSFSGNSSGVVTVQSGTGASAAPPFTPSGSVSVSATFTGTANQATSLAGGDPVANYQAITFFRQ